MSLFDPRCNSVYLLIEWWMSRADVPGGLREIVPNKIRAPETSKAG